jgi:hypothetical protein
MLECGRRNLSSTQSLRMVDPTTGNTFFRDITKDDIVGSGKISAVGARHFAERARRVQNLTQLYQIKLQDPTVAAHLSGKEFARIMAEELGEAKLFAENIMISEQLETQQAGQEAEMKNQDQLMQAQQMGL